MYSYFDEENISEQQSLSPNETAQRNAGEGSISVIQPRQNE